MLFLKYLLWPAFAVFALWWLLRGGRPRYPKKTFLAAMAAAAAVFGLWLGAEPDPVEGVMGVVRGLASGGNVRGALFLLLFFSVLSVAGNKLVCGWGCPMGALQELLYELSPFREIKRNQLPFLLTMPVRTLAVGLFAVALLGWGSDLYAVIDPFGLFTPGRARSSALVASALFLFLALAVYRPFCQLLCPFGWYSWFLERLSFFRIRVNRRTCIRCNACARACPLEAARGRLLDSPVPADCFSCARCLRVCPTGAIDYGARWRKSKT